MTDPVAPRPGSWLPPKGTTTNAAPVTLTATTPARDVSRVRCPKCGSGETGLSYSPPAPPCDRGCCSAEAESFRRWCKACGYRWRTHDVVTPPPTPPTPAPSDAT